MSCTITKTKTKNKTRNPDQVLRLRLEPAITQGDNTTTTTGAMGGLQTPPMTPTETSVSGTNVVVSGRPITATELANMGEILVQARAAGEFPTTTAAGYDATATIQDFARLMHLRHLRVGLTQAEWTTDQAASEYLVTVTSEIRERDETRAEEAATASVQARVAGMMNGVQAESTIYQLMRHAVHSVLQSSDIQQAGANSGIDMTAVVQDVDRRLNELTAAHEGVSAVITQMRNTVQPHISAVAGVDMEAVMEEVFATIERSLLDATGPLRLNINRMNGQYDRMDGQIDNVTSIADVQLNAIGQHVNAIDGHVHALGNNIGSMGSLVNSTNTNVQALGTNLQVLQTIVNMLPQMVIQAIQEMLPSILHEAVQQSVQASVTQIITARLQGLAQAALAGRAQTVNKKNGKKGGFMNKFFGIFKKNDRGDGHGPSGSGPGMAA
ncbi:hypothetical protein F4810DRAFT_724979 [Camillea tinctor]|nr:hypothetical protein F4810DRAFT_724979 [Camillea tinctor]